MTLQHSRQVAEADWWAGAATHWSTLVTLGPPGHAAYAQISLPTADVWRPDAEVFSDLVAVLRQHTPTGGRDCRFGLWDGWGDIDGGDAVGMLTAMEDRDKWFTPVFGRRRERQVPPAFSPSVLGAPRIAIGERQFLLFIGSLDEAGQWGARPIAADWPPRQISIPNLTWPVDQSWSVAADPELNTVGVGGSRALVDAVVRHPRLDARVVPYPDAPPLTEWDAGGPNT